MILGQVIYGEHIQAKNFKWREEGWKEEPPRGGFNSTQVLA